jgi:hypothetical protein
LQRIGCAVNAARLDGGDKRRQLAAGQRVRTTTRQVTICMATEPLGHE